MQQQLKFSDQAGTILPITLAKGQDSTYPYQGGARDCIDFQISGNDIGFNTLDTLTASVNNTSKLILITDDVDPSGQPIHTEAELLNYTMRAEWGKTIVQVSPETGTAPAVYEERMHVVLAQKTYGEVLAEQQAMAIDALGQQVVALSLGGVS